MPYRINHIHLKASDPRKTADWYVKAFDFQIVSDEVRERVPDAAIGLTGRASGYGAVGPPSTCPGREAPSVIDARVKPHHAPPLVDDPEIEKRVDALGAAGEPLHGII